MNVKYTLTLPGAKAPEYATAGAAAADLFAVTPVRLPLPEKAQNFESYPCALCGEPVAAPWIRFQEGQMRCLDCAVPYRRLDL